MEKTIGIKNIGEHQGTVGWLCGVIDYIDVAVNMENRLGAWIHYRAYAGLPPQCIVRDVEDIGLTTIERDSYSPNPGPYLDITVTDSCWRAISAIAISVRDMMMNDPEVWEITWKFERI